MTLWMKIQEEREEARAEGYAEGYAEGFAEGFEEESILQSMASLVKDGLIDLKIAADRLNMTVEEFQTAASL